MDTGPHRVLAVGVVLAAAHTWSMPAGQVWVTGAVAALTGGGVLSPDVDNQRASRRLDGVLPDEILGGGGPLQHRGITHWWAWPALLAVFLTWGPAVPTVASWALWGVTAGWAAHLLGDFAQGAGNPQWGLKAGVPLGPWWWHVGTGIACGSATARVMNGAVYAATVWAAVTLLLGLPLVPSQAVLEALR